MNIMHKSHFFLGNSIAETRNFTPQNQGYGGKDFPKIVDRVAHATFVKERYENAVNEIIDNLEKRERQGLPVANGMYVDLEMDSKFVPLSFGKQNGKSGATIMKVTEKSGEMADVTVFVKKSKRDWLSDKADIYATENKKSGSPKFADKIEPINNVVPTDIRTLYISADEFDAIPNEGMHTYELWISHCKENTSVSIKKVLEQLGITEVSSPLVFDGVDVWLVSANKQQLIELPLSLGYIEGIRPYHKPSVLLASHAGSREWVDLIKSITVNVDEQPKVLVGILDSGVNNAHALLQSQLPNERMDVAIGVAEATDKIGHGTGMAGLSLYGDLTDIANLRNPVFNLQYGLSSVKIVDDNYEADKEFYGAIIEESITKASEMGAAILCMAVTDEDSYDGLATSSSAALDESIYHNGLCDRLVFVSAGNVKVDDVDRNNYLESCKAHAIKSPAQAWNALTVGAYTEKTVCLNTDYIPLAAPGGVSPYSSSSYQWCGKRNKPEIVMEGGNIAYHSLLKNTPLDDLSLVTTCMDLKESLESFNATSAATALATRLAARIKVENPQLSMLSVRGLLVHSAKWTEEMRRIDDIEERMSLCGYGVPNENMAIYSSEQYATYIFENTLIPYEEKNGNAYHQLHYYNLPWPKELLEEMGSENVKIRITLSYYVKPSPGYAGRTSKYRYPSATLHFDLKKSTETTAEFLSRNNKNEGEKTTENDSNRWAIKKQRRERGTVQSDWIDCTATALAELEQIVVYPGPGWWKERKLKNVDNLVPYSLIVSIESKETEIYNAVEAAINNSIGVKISNEI